MVFFSVFIALLLCWYLIHVITDMNFIALQYAAPEMTLLCRYNYNPGHLKQLINFHLSFYYFLMNLEVFKHKKAGLIRQRAGMGLGGAVHMLIMKENIS